MLITWAAAPGSASAAAPSAGSGNQGSSDPAWDLLSSCPAGTLIATASGRLRSYLQVPSDVWKVEKACNVDDKYRDQIVAAQDLLSQCIGSELAIGEVIKKNANVFENLLGGEDPVLIVLVVVDQTKACGGIIIGLILIIIGLIGYYLL